MEKSNGKKMPVEVYFLRYSYPCAYIIKDRGDITEEQLDELKNAVLKGVKLPREKLENTFKNAFHNIRLLAKEMGKDTWDYDVVREYFTKKHNEILDAGGPIDGIKYHSNTPKHQVEICKIRVGEIKSKKDDILEVSLDAKVTKVLAELVPNAKPGDKVAVHYRYAVEIL